MRLSRQHLKAIPVETPVNIPGTVTFDFPERVLQFGTGVLLRALPDYFIDKANKKGIFQGRVVVVKSTSTGSTDAFSAQDNLYTVTVRGIEAGEKIESNTINASVSRVLSAASEWEEILQCASNPEMKIVISNTTEVGIVLVEDSVFDNPPVSFPGKLLSFLYKRYQVFGGVPSAGMVIIPTELIPDNGNKLVEILRILACRNELEPSFITWLSDCNYICNSLVDRIVPGLLPEGERKEMERRLGYEDQLMTMAEPYRLWAIESLDEKVREILSFSRADESMIIAPDISQFRELKLRLLNGPHTFCCGLAFLSGFATVKAAMQDETMSRFIEQIMLNEITPVLTGTAITDSQAREFAVSVMDRFRNPYIEHQWLSIAAQYSSKMRMRNIPILNGYYEKYHKVPEHIALAFAAYLLFMKAEKRDTGYEGDINGIAYPVNDVAAEIMVTCWKQEDTRDVVQMALQDENLWGQDISLLPGFAGSVTGYLKKMMERGCRETMEEAIA